MLLKLGEVPALIISSPQFARDILKTHDHIFASRPSLKSTRILLYNGKDMVFAPYGDYWKKIRKLCVNKLLSATMVQSFRPIREHEVEVMCNKIHEMCLKGDDEVINVSEVLNFFANDILCKAISGNYFREEKSELICKLVEEISLITGGLWVGDFVPWLGWLDFFVESRAKRVLTKWEVILDEIIEYHEKMLKEVEGVDDDDDDEKLDFVDVLLAVHEDGDGEFLVTKDIIKALIVDMIVAGTETTFIVLDWGMTELIRNPQTMKKLQDEVREISDTKSIITIDDITKMRYLKAVVKETLRLHPPAPLLIPHESMETCNLHGYEIPKKTRVIINAWAISRDPQVWQEPEEFKPERFLGSDSKDFRGHDFEFVPFGGGRRICPGMQFSVSTLETAFANLVNKFDWRLPDGMRSEDLDMGESLGLATRRRRSLHLVAKPRKI